MRATWPAWVREAVQARDLWVCVLCGVRADAVHHRLPRGMGGTRRVVTPAWGICLCGDCHGAVESHRADATACGLLVPSGSVPALVPVWYAAVGGWRSLDDEGSWTALAREPRPVGALLTAVTAH